MSAGRHIVARAVLSRANGCYAGSMTLFGFAYHLEITRHEDGLLVIAFDGPVAEGYRIEGLDDAQEGQP